MLPPPTRGRAARAARLTPRGPAGGQAGRAVRAGLGLACWLLPPCLAGLAAPAATANTNDRAAHAADPALPVSSGSTPPAQSGGALFALVIGVNRAVDAELPPLRYADDDAARFFDLFRSLGARTYLHAELDDNTRALHPQAAAEAQAPALAALERNLARLTEDIALARARRLHTTLYVLYAGHGKLSAGQGHLALRDARLDARWLADQLVRRPAADRVHFIIDACHAHFLAYARGSEAQRRPLSGYSQLGAALAQEHVGLLLATSASGESHEWEAFQAGVFSHEVRSALYGAADVDGDGLITYQEVAAFVARANAAVPNERFRPAMVARPPADSGLLVDVRPGRERAIELDGDQHGHFLLEDSRGVRLLDFHNAPGQRLALLRPPGGGLLYLRDARGEREWALPPAAEPLALAALSPARPSAQPRGAAHAAFSLLFSLPFDRQQAQAFDLQPLAAQLAALAAEGAEPLDLRPLAWVAIGAGAGMLAAGLTTTLTTISMRDSLPRSTPQLEVAELNGNIHARNAIAVGLYVGGGLALSAGLGLLLWPADRAVPPAGSSPRPTDALSSAPDHHPPAAGAPWPAMLSPLLGLAPGQIVIGLRGRM